METTEDIVVKLTGLTYGFASSINGKASFGTLIKAFNFIDPNFNHAFSAGYGATFDNTGTLIGVDGFGLFKYLHYETHPILHVDNTMYLLMLTGELMNDKYEISIARTDYKYTLDDINKPEVYDPVMRKHNINIQEIVNNLQDTTVQIGTVFLSDPDHAECLQVRIEYDYNTVYFSIWNSESNYYKRINK